MKIDQKTLSKYTFWLSFFSGIPFLIGLVPFQSLNISFFPALILLIKSNKVIYLDCFVAFCMLINYFLTWLFFSDLSGFITLIEFSSVVISYIAFRTFPYMPSGRSITVYLLASILIGIFQVFLFSSGYGGTRGVPLLASEPSRYARIFAVLLVPIFINWQHLRQKLGLPILIFIFSSLIFLNRSASLIIPMLIISFSILLVSINYFKRFINTLKINKFFLFLYSSIILFLTISISYFGRTSRITSFLFSIIKVAFLQSELLNMIRTFGGRRISTVIYSLQTGITSIIPNGIDSAKNILNYENLTNSYIGLKPYHERILSSKESFESASFFSHYILDAGFFAFIISIMFTFLILKIVSKTSLKLLFNNKTSNWIKIESALRSSSCYVGLISLWFFSTNSYIQPWLLIAVGLMPYHKNKTKIED